MTFHTSDFRAAGFSAAENAGPQATPYDGLASPAFPRFILEQCRRFSAARDGLGAFPIDAVSEALNQAAPEGSAYSAFGLLHEIVRILSIEGRSFRWYPDCCRFASLDEKLLMEACLHACFPACAFRQAALDQSLSHLVDASFRNRLATALRDLTVIMGVQAPQLRL